MKAKIISVMLILSMFSTSIPVLAKDDINIDITDSETIKEMAPTPIPQSEAYYTPDTKQEEVLYEPKVHTEILPSDIQFSEEEYNIMGDRMPSPYDASTFATRELVMDDSWKETFAMQFGDSYIKPYEKREDGQTVTGNTNRLVIEETDLSLAGKNGLDVVLKRRHDNQDYNIMYSAYNTNTYGETRIPTYIRAFKNARTNKKIYIAFYTKDDFYAYMGDGCYLDNIDNLNLSTYDVGTQRYSFYEFSEIVYYMSDDSTGDLYTCDYSVEPIEITRRLGKHSLWAFSDRSILTGRSSIGDNWYLMLPEIYLLRYNRETYTDHEGQSNESTLYYDYYVGAFRDYEGNIMYLTGEDLFEKYKDNSKGTKYWSSFKCKDNQYLELEKTYEHKVLPNSDIQYNFTVKDSRGLTYYLYDPYAKETEKPKIKQKLAVLAIEDEYGNMIRYEYDNEFYQLNKIIDTYGREINITRADNSTTVSYYDDTDNTTKTIVYEISTLPSTELNNDSSLKREMVNRFTVTNQVGEKTIYDSRKTDTITKIDTNTSSINSIIRYPGIDKTEQVEHDFSNNIERIIYPTGAETHYTYKYIFLHSMTNHVIHGVYGVSSSYDVVDNKQENKEIYSFEGKCDNIIITQTNESADQKTVRRYNDKGLLRQEEITPINKISPRRTTNYEYDAEDNKPKKVSVSDDGIYYSTNYSYESNYPDRLTSETTRRNCRIDYTYHTVNRHTTNKVKTAIYYSKLDTKFVEDYIISTGLTADGKSIEYERVTKNNVLQSQTKYEYDSEGNVSAVKRWTKDTNGDGVLDENDEFVTTSSTHEMTANNTRQITNCIANVKNADGINEGNVVTEYKMNVYGAPTYQKDSYGTETTIEYDTLNRPVKYNLPNGSSTTVEYVIDANKKNSYTIATDAAGIQYKNLYDGIGRIKAKYRLNGSSWEMLEGYAYDTAGRLSEKEYGQNGAERVKEVYTYDSLNRLSTKKVYENWYTLMYTETYRYSKGTVTKSTVGADGTQKADEVTKYDPSGNILESGLKSGDETIISVFEYDYLNRRTKETDPNGNSTTYEYDCLGNLLKTTNALGHSVSAQYDLAGRAISSTDPKGNTTVTDYDQLGRAIQVTAPFDDSRNAITKTYYDKNSNVVKKSVRKNGNKYYSDEYKYDNMGNLIAAISGDTGEQSVVQYSYDAANRMTKMITGLSAYSESPTGGSVTQYEYDDIGFLHTTIDPMGSKQKNYQYDVYGNVQVQNDRNGNVFQYTYGLYGVKVISAALGPQNKTTYNGIGQVISTTAENQNGETVEESYTYDQFGRIATKTSNDGTVQSYTYDKNSNVLTYKMDKDGETKNDIAYTYNSLNRLTKFDNGDMILTYVYDVNENLFVVLNNKTLDYDYMFTYNKANLPTKIEMDYGKNSYNYTMSYWTNGQKYLEQDTVNDTWTEYNYNSLGQLTLEHKMKGLETISELKYTYDSSGNRTQMQSFNEDITKWDVVTDYTYDANNRMTSATRSELGDVTNTAHYYYDRNGNTLAEQNKSYTTSGEESSDMALSGRVGSSTTKVYTYDRLNRLMQYNDGSTEAVYTYGVDNLRASKKVNGEKTEFVWNGQNLAGETTDGISTIYNYDVTGIAGYKKDNEEEVRYIKDPHGNVIDMQQGKDFIGSYDYSAFGNQLTSTNEDNPFRYCGEYYDKESGNIYLRNRYYNAPTGRFISEDPYWNIDNMIYGDNDNDIPDMDAIMQSSSRYSYCKNNPVNLYDPSGQKNTGDFSVVYKEIMNILICQSRWASASKTKRDDLHIWANYARDLVKKHVNEKFAGEGFARLVNEVISDADNKTMEETSALLYVAAEYSQKLKSPSEENLVLSYNEVKKLYDKAVSQNTLYYIDFPIGSDINSSELISNYLGTSSPSISWDKSYRNNGKRAMNAFGGAPNDTEEFNYAKGIK